MFYNQSFVKFCKKDGDKKKPPVGEAFSNRYDQKIIFFFL